MPPRPDEKRRQELLDELEAIMLAEGFSHLRIGALAERLHCSRSTLYKLAPSKTELFVLVFERWSDRAFDGIIAYAEEGETPAEKILRQAEEAGRVTAQGSAAFWRDVRDEPRAAAVLSRARSRGHRATESFIQQGIDAGTLRPVNTAYVGYIIWSAAAASRDPDLMAEFDTTPQEAYEMLAELVAGGLAV